MGGLALRVYWPRPCDHRSRSAASRARMVGVGTLDLRICVGYCRLCCSEQTDPARAFANSNSVLNAHTLIDLS
jgi:hypothetical protein